MSVTIIKNIFSPEECKDLIALWNSKNQPSRIMRDGPAIKSRRDHLITNLSIVQKNLDEKVLPILKEKCKTAETLPILYSNAKVARYVVNDYYKPHVDFAKHEVHCPYSLSVNLNYGEFEGGQFHYLPTNEYFSTQSGDGILFDGRELHEVTKITKGERFVFLTHMHV